MTDQKYGPVREDTTLIERTAQKRPKLADTAYRRQPFPQEELDTEKWRPVVGYEDRFQISNLGRVRGLKHHPNLGRRPVPIRKTRIGRDGYEHFVSSIIVDGNRRSVHLRVHRLVATAFHPNPENLPIVHHKDSNRLNNRAGNLEWATQSQNVRHAMDSNPDRAAFIGQLHLHSSRANPTKRKINNQPL